MTTCDWDGLQCLNNNSDLLDSIGSVTFDQALGAECACPPACSKTRYTSTISTAKFPNKASRYFKEFGNENLSLVHVYFADLKMSRYIADELFSWQDILAAFGGQFLRRF